MQVAYQDTPSSLLISHHRNIVYNLSPSRTRADGSVQWECESWQIIYHRSNFDGDSYHSI